MNYLLEGVGKENVVRRETVYALGERVPIGPKRRGDGHPGKFGGRQDHAVSASERRAAFHQRFPCLERRSLAETIRSILSPAKTDAEQPFACFGIGGVGRQVCRGRLIPLIWS